MADNLVDRVAGIITRYSMLPRSGRIGVAVSGGADSVVLLHLLHRLRVRFPCELVVLHVNHQLRGEASDGDEQFVRELAASLGWPIAVERSQVPPGNLEQAAREVRRAFFARLRNELALDRIALGHTLSDQAETVLYRFLRGSGTAGLAGMRPVTAAGLIRPMLGLTRQEVREWAITERTPWREDASNQDSRFARNLLRNEAMPRLATQFNPGLEGVLAGTADIAQAEENYWEDLVSTTYSQITELTALGSFFQIEQLANLHPALRRRVIRRAVTETRGDLRGIDLLHIDSILNLCDSTEGHDRTIIPGVDALRSYGTLLLMRPDRLSEKRHYRVGLEVGQTVQLPFDLGRIRLNSMPLETQNCAKVEIDQSPSTEISYLDSDALRGPVYVRNWEPGDRLRQPGHDGSEKIKSLFQEHRILLWERRHWPVAVCGDEVIWARRFGCSAETAAGSGTRQVLRLEYSV